MLRTIAKWSQRNRYCVSDHQGVLFSHSREQLPLNLIQKLCNEFLNQTDIPTPLQWAPWTKAPLPPQILTQVHLREVGCPQEEHGLTANALFKEQGVQAPMPDLSLPVVIREKRCMEFEEWRFLKTRDPCRWRIIQLYFPGNCPDIHLNRYIINKHRECPWSWASEPGLKLMCHEERSLIVDTKPQTRKWCKIKEGFLADQNLSLLQ